MNPQVLAGLDFKYSATLRISDEVAGHHPRHASIGRSLALAQADSPAFYEMAKRRAQPGCFAPPSHAF